MLHECSQSQLLGRMRQKDLLSTQVWDQPRKHRKTSSLNKQIHRKLSGYKKAAVLCLSYHLSHSLTNMVQFPWLNGADLPATKLETRSWAKTPPALQFPPNGPCCPRFTTTDLLFLQQNPCFRILIAPTIPTYVYFSSVLLPQTPSLPIWSLLFIFNFLH